MTSTEAHEYLSAAACWDMLHSTDIGRLAVTIGGRPDIFPVNYAVADGYLLVRTAGGSKLSAAAGERVAFEVDGYAPGISRAWSVVLKGHADELTELADLAAADELPLTPLHGAPKHRFLRIVPQELSGRRFVTVPVWERPDAPVSTPIPPAKASRCLSPLQPPSRNRRHNPW
ncbi:pyridoxamine 5'-phosphate oxidase family protein [Kineosporia sp. J2-2]|uniref:Pyridoxamine 5'-phosphate oxidase family protein n=1 Tax=Kineosporia corallincola TaxID=2835133 RepID=A0ABS5TRH2_9ACTN|nr:pyridoxamine 5'-phosphate oxidase family protein [Kineosporia corallincola]MBT0773402.1 pyridoxamine 5'-phosphate oxidase family protein [Kineosporia corallincola]